MAIYSLGINTTVSTSASPALDYQAASGNNPKCMEYGLNLAAATISQYGLARSSNTPTQSAPVTVLAENYSDPAGKTTAAVTWTTAPTAPSNYARRIYLPGTGGAGVIWTFPRGYTLQGATASLALFCLVASAASLNNWAVFDE